ncbi:uncharacterized protein LOC135983863 [Chrysemys picta bellii]|uniref:uncharacterized protein LOC135983863 n=1 Tax=Chrysemys picta bellii TaxID=8478 RepID=UPI0032B2D634
MMERGHDQDALHCRVKVKELRNAYHKACKANSCFYKELDAIHGGDPTSTPKTIMDTSEPRSTRQEEEESVSEGAEEEGDSPAALDACSQARFSSQEEGSQSQWMVFGEGQTPEELPDATLRSQLSLLSMAERLQRIRKCTRKSKEDMLHEMMQQSLNENQKVQEWRESERRVRQQNEDRRHQSTERLLSIMEHQADSIQALIAMQGEHFRPHPPCSPCPKTLSLVPPCHHQPTFPNIQVLIATSCLHHPALQTTTLTHCTQPPSPCILASLKCITHCTALQTGRLSMITGHTQICDCPVPHRTPFPRPTQHRCVMPFLFLKQLCFFSINDFFGFENFFIIALSKRYRSPGKQKALQLSASYIANRFLLTLEPLHFTPVQGTKH